MVAVLAFRGFGCVCARRPAAHHGLGVASRRLACCLRPSDKMRTITMLAMLATAGASLAADKSVRPALKLRGGLAGVDPKMAATVGSTLFGINGVVCGLAEGVATEGYGVKDASYNIRMPLCSNTSRLSIQYSLSLLFLYTFPATIPSLSQSKWSSRWALRSSPSPSSPSASSRGCHSAPRSAGAACRGSFSPSPTFSTASLPRWACQLLASTSCSPSTPPQCTVACTPLHARPTWRHSP